MPADTPSPQEPQSIPLTGEKILRIAIVATPRSGNTWLRHLLSSLYELENIVIDRPEELPVDRLPARCVIQLHWSAEPGLIRRFQEHQITPVTIARHPCDVLVSILHFSTTWPNTALWCGGHCGDESSIAGRLPASSEFLRYAIGPRARHLLEVSPGWWQSGAACCVRYESLVANTAAELRRLADRLEPVDDESIQQAVRENSMEYLQSLVHNQHYWRGRPGAWREFLPEATAREIIAAHGDLFEVTGYPTDVDTGLDERQSDRNWLNQEVISLRQELSRTREQLRRARDTAAQNAHEIAQLRQLVEPIVSLDTDAFRTAKRMDRLARRHPQVYAAMVTCLRPLIKRAA